MKRPKAHPDNLFFPIPPARIDRTLERTPLQPAVAATYLEEILRWRDAVITAVVEDDQSVDLIENLTSRARSRLMTLMATRWDARTLGWAAAAAYHLTPFPVSVPASQVERPMEAVMDVLHWRVAVLNYLTDIWDTIARPELDMGECVAIGEFMRPARLEERCVYCLTEFPFDRLDPEAHGCVMTGVTHTA